MPRLLYSVDKNNSMGVGEGRKCCSSSLLAIKAKGRTVVLERGGGAT